MRQTLRLFRLAGLVRLVPDVLLLLDDLLDLGQRVLQVRQRIGLRLLRLDDEAIQFRFHLAQLDHSRLLRVDRLADRRLACGLIAQGGLRLTHDFFDGRQLAGEGRNVWGQQRAGGARVKFEAGLPAAQAARPQLIQLRHLLGPRVRLLLLRRRQRALPHALLLVDGAFHLLPRLAQCLQLVVRVAHQTSQLLNITGRLPLQIGRSAPALLALRRRTGGPQVTARCRQIIQQVRRLDRRFHLPHAFLLLGRQQLPQAGHLIEQVAQVAVDEALLTGQSLGSPPRVLVLARVRLVLVLPGELGVLQILIQLVAPACSAGRPPDRDP